MNRQFGHSFRLAAICVALAASTVQASAYDDHDMKIVATVRQNEQFNNILHNARCTRNDGYRYMRIEIMSRAVLQGCWHYSREQDAIVYSLESGQHGVWPLERVQAVKGMDLHAFALTR